MIQKIRFDLWQRYSRLGVRPEQSLAVQKRIQLTNQVAAVAFVVLFLLNTAWTNFDPEFSLFVLANYLSIFSIWIVPWRNARGGYLGSTILLSVLTPFFTIAFTILSKMVHPQPDVYFYFTGRVILLSELIIPLILIDLSRWRTLTVVLALHLGYLFSYDLLHRAFGVGLDLAQAQVGTSYLGINYFMLYPTALLLFGFYFLLSLNQRYETQNTQLVTVLSHQNGQLEAQKTEISAQLEEISSQKETIEAALRTIEHKNKSITDSIHYAKRIQAAVLRADELSSNIWAERMLYTRARDIVSGDFFFFHQSRRHVYLAVADCTGHGVPGAFMSLLGVTLLNEMLRHYDITDSAVVLDRLRVELKAALKQTGQAGEQQDGLDIAFCIIDKHTLMLNYAGAHNPLWLFRPLDDRSDVRLIELPADNQPVGVFLRERPFASQLLQLQPGDVFYLFSDGYHSQLGGPNRDKLMKRTFRNLLHQMAQLPFGQQEHLLDQHLSQWQQGAPQTDDLMILGVRM